MQIREIVIADDHPIVLTALRAQFREYPQWKVRSTCRSGHELLECLKTEGLPDVILLDIRMPLQDGLETMNEIRDQFGSSANVIALSSHEEIYVIQKMLACGAMGYVPKSADTQELIQAMEAVCEGQHFVSTSLSQSLVHQQIVPEAPIVELSSVEEEIIRLVAEQKSTVEISKEMGLSRHTVNTYRARLLSKTKSYNTVGLVLYGIRTGLCRV